MQSALRLIYPARCMTCGDLTDTDFALCGPCWRDTPFIAGLVCDACGAPLPGEDRGEQVLCDDCMTVERPWSKGRAAMLYAGNGRRIVLALKHGDRTDLVRAVVAWMALATKPVLTPDTILVPVPLHWTRLLTRRYNQSALLAQALARQVGLDWCPDALVRPRRTASLGGLSPDGRFSTMEGAIRPHAARGKRLAGRPVLLVDDVMTSGATLAAATHAAREAGATDVCVILLARAAKET